jgi:hypothetical protein
LRFRPPGFIFKYRVGAAETSIPDATNQICKTDSKKPGRPGHTAKGFTMKKNTCKVAAITLVAFLLTGCPPSMELLNEELLFRNDSNASVRMLLNLSYPDSSLSKAFPEQYRDPGDNSYIGNFFDLKTLPGLTLFVFEFNYFEFKWSEQVGSPDTYLEQDSILARYVLSRRELDSLKWRIVYP